MHPDPTVSVSEWRVRSLTPSAETLRDVVRTLDATYDAQTYPPLTAPTPFPRCCYTHSSKGIAGEEKVDTLGRKTEEEGRMFQWKVAKVLGGWTVSTRVPLVNWSGVGEGGEGVPEYTPGISNEPSLWMTWPRIKCMGFRSNASRGVCQGAYLVPKDECNRSLLSPPTEKGNGGDESTQRMVHVVVVLALFGITNWSFGRAGRLSRDPYRSLPSL